MVEPRLHFAVWLEACITLHTLTLGYRVFLQFSWSLWHLFLACEMPVSPAPVGQIKVEDCLEWDTAGGF